MADNVRAVIFNPEGKFLIVTELDDPDNWKLPGGKMDKEESPEDAIKRELLEEIGLKTEGPFIYKQLVTDDGSSNRYIFKVNAKQQDIIPSKDEIAKTQWCDKSSVPECQNKNHILSALESIS
jgi:ADP-ribose pyrophosphatase YjhB (NUDIX family)